MHLARTAQDLMFQSTCKNSFHAMYQRVINVACYQFLHYKLYMHMDHCGLKQVHKTLKTKDKLL